MVLGGGARYWRSRFDTSKTNEPALGCVLGPAFLRPYAVSTAERDPRDMLGAISTRWLRCRARLAPVASASGHR